ncbi:MAG: transcriptional repressor [Lachnospiraceae bacterium]|nr:transcriptional repressor [Lachnospiraceae bacterium]
MSEKEVIIDKLKKRGYRITKQRKILLDIILEDQCTSCKEIYYKASKQDSEIGAATVYRMINTLEEIGAINRGNMYKIDWEESKGTRSASEDEECTIVFEDDSKLQIPHQIWNQVVLTGLEACGYGQKPAIRNIVLETN